MMKCECDKCGKVFKPESDPVTNLHRIVWEERFTITILADGFTTSGNVHLCPGCIKLAVADWKPKL